MKQDYDAIVVGSGPNGMAAAVRLALEGYSVKVFEAGESIGGGTRTLELTEPGFMHDICSAIHPMAISSPFLRSLPLESHGLEWIQPEIPLAHPMDDGPAVLQHRDLGNMKDELGDDFKAYEKLFHPLGESWHKLASELLGPLRLPNRPLRMALFGINALQSAEGLINRKFSTGRAKALFAGLAAHSLMPLDKTMSSAIGLVLGAAAHSVGWPLAKGGSGKITGSMAAYLETLGGEIETGRRVTDLKMLPAAKAILFDLTPKQVLKIAGDRFPESYRIKHQKYRNGAGDFIVDYILKE
ncbi:MAG: NAD(P)/FAD-dependent oxidoreductase, partial [Balneolaceae bacterium]